MSAYVGPHPAPPVFGDADWSDNDAYGLDCRANMALRGDQIAGASLVGVTRQDGAALQSGDLAVTAVGVVPAGTTIYGVPGGPVTATAGMFVAWKGQGGIAGSGYLVKLLLTLASGGTINRTVAINVPSYVG
jgi:hypothetical protein